jgi:hypothetical protein
MAMRVIGIFALLLVGTFGLRAQNSGQPLYRITVVSRTIDAINYGHRSEPTKIGFRGTVLLPDARGEATVQSKRGAVEIMADFSHLQEPSLYGPQFLTYVLWAISPEGRPVNLGELVPNHANKGKLNVTTDLQAFALLVTAEPYFSVTVPSDVVVMENVLRPETVGQVQQVNVKYELMPRNAYTFDKSARPANEGRPMVSMDEYESLSALYQAQNALQNAKYVGADQYAADTYAKADGLYRQAQSYQSQKGSSRQVVTTAREATQAAEDARIITLKRQQAAGGPSQ